jgi:GNAT superfamily N-acetyltransferase
MPRERARIRIETAGTKHIRQVVPLFDAYRRFYEQSSDPRGARRFLLRRLRRRESVIFLAFLSGKESIALGFTQLYPCFSSISMRRTWILNDLYVAPEARGKGAGKALMEAARRLALKTGADSITLETGIPNRVARRLYEQLGYERDRAYYRYSLRIRR